jgi:hypothetical protein
MSSCLHSQVPWQPSSPGGWFPTKAQLLPVGSERFPDPAAGSKEAIGDQASTALSTGRSRALPVMGTAEVFQAEEPVGLKFVDHLEV